MMLNNVSIWDGGCLRTLLFLAVALQFSEMTWAESKLIGPSSNIKLGEVLEDKKFEEDTRIDDPEMRAKAGSLSRYSLQFVLDFYGPPVNDLDNPLKPNPDNRPGDPRTVLMGTAGFRYRVTPNVGINLSTGLAFFEPVQATKGEEQTRPRPGFDNYGVNDPSLSVDRTYILLRSQMRSNIRATLTTNQSYLDRGQTGMVSFFHEAKHQVGTSRYVLSIHLIGQYLFYDRGYRGGSAENKYGDGNVYDYNLILAPGLEYKITPSLNGVLALAYSYQNLRRVDSWWKWSHQMSVLQTGVGWAITRDIYLRPHLDIFTEAPAINTASLNLNTIFSIF
jgi:hypothetical protein